MSGRCQDCKWFRCDTWTAHKTPRIANGARITCEWPVPDMVLPISITRKWDYRNIKSGSYADPNWTDCPTFEAK
jgi:hypothetical protein